MQEHYQILNFDLCRIAQSRQIFFILEGIKIRAILPNGKYLNNIENRSCQNMFLLLGIQKQ